MKVHKLLTSFLCPAIATVATTGQAPALMGTANGIQAWVKTPSQESCLSTPYGQIVNGCSSVVEIDLPAYAVHYKQMTSAGVWVKWDGSGNKPQCQVISVTDSSTLVSATPVSGPSGTNWTEVTGSVNPSMGGAFIACWLQPGDSLSSYWWQPGWP